MSDHSELNRLAQRVIDIEALDGGEPIGEAWGEFEAAANPAAVLDLISDNERLKVDLREQKDAKLGLSWAIGEIMGECDQLKAEVERLNSDNASLRGSCAKLGVEHAGMVRIHRKANTEIRRLSAEVEALRKDAERYRWLREKVGVDLIFGDYNPWLLSCNTDMTDLEKKTTDEAIDAAMTKGAKP